jgi:hypothetical protein
MTEEPSPIYSTLDPEGAGGDILDGFMLALAERVDALQDAEYDSDLAHLGVLAIELSQAANEAGYPALVQIAQQVARSCIEDKPEEAQSALEALTDLSQLIRKGHRGSA